jgi:recombination protein RecA
MRRRRIEPEPEAFIPELPPRDPTAAVFASIADRSKAFRPAREMLRRVRAVPTIFPYYDMRTRVGGHPLDRIALVHGPSSHGKTLLVQGLGLSFLRRGHGYCLVDAEMTTPIVWLETLMAEHADNPRFMALRPRSYEQATDAIRRTALAIADERKKGNLPDDFTCLFAVDSLTSLVPEDLMDRIQKFGAEGEKGSVDGYSGASGLLMANLNQAWLRSLVPLMYETGCSILFIARESKKINATVQERAFGNDWQIKGGGAGFYESSLVARVLRAKWITVGRDDSDAKQAIGERHLVEIHKTKVAAHQDRVERAYFHTSNGVMFPEGFDRRRDLLELGRELGVIKTSGTWLAYGRSKWQGEMQFLKGASPEMLDGIEAACRSRFAEDAGRHAEVVT